MRSAIDQDDHRLWYDRAFATVETIASRYAIQYKDLVELSAQQLISCDVIMPDLDGCNGGALLSAFGTVQKVSLPTIHTSFPQLSMSRRINIHIFVPG